MRRVLVLIGLISIASLSARAQTFSSGSTGADGALDLTSGDRAVQLPESGVLNYTTVNVPSGRTLTFRRNSRNTPVHLLAQGNVTISGQISVAGGSDPDQPPTPRTPGPGGFYGGDINQPGFGPGGGQVGQNGRWVGPLTLVPIIGGSGGGFNCFHSPCRAGGGGGAIVIASSTSIVLINSGSISASPSGDDSLGSGGAIRLVSNSIDMGGVLFACGGFCGVVRLEAPQGAITFTGTSDPPAVLSTINPSVVPNAPPTLTIVSVGGFSVPSYAGQRFDTVDLLLPSQLTDPITVVVQGNNIPVGTQVSVGVVSGSPSATTTTSALQGTFSSSTASPTISNLNRTAVTYLLASATFDPPPGSAPSNQKGANYVDKVRLEALIGAKPKYIFLRKDGTVINPDKLRPDFLAHFGQ